MGSTLETAATLVTLLQWLNALIKMIRRTYVMDLSRRLVLNREKKLTIMPNA